MRAIWVARLALALTLPLSSTASDYIYTTNDNVVTVTGYVGTNTTIIVPDIIDGLPVVKFGTWAFCGNTNLISITIPISVTNFGDYVFYGCTHLTTINVDADNPTYSGTNGVLFNKNQTTLIKYPANKDGGYTVPSGVTSVGESAFEGCVNLLNVVIPNSVTFLGDGAFNLCISLTNVIVPDSVTNLGIWAFNGCSALANVQLGDNVSEIGDCTFKDCINLGSVIIPDSVTSIGEEAFSGSGLGSIHIGKNVAVIGPWAFLGTSLYDIKIPDSVVEIETLSFCDCHSLQHVEIGTGLRILGRDAFYNCDNVQVYFFGDAPSIRPGDPIFGSNSEYPLTSKIYRPDDATGWPDAPGLWAGRPMLLWQPDSDADGIPDFWGRKYFGGATNANPNAVCSNGVNTVREAYIAGLNPHDKQSILRSSLHQSSPAVFDWNSVSGRVYSVYWTTNLLSGFQCLESNIPWTRNSFTNWFTVPNVYYKIDVRLP